MALIARNLDTGTVLADRVSVAATRASRRAGLLHHDSLDDGEALWIVPSRGVHTFRMRFAIDVLALDEAGVIIDRVVNLKPWRIRLPRRGTAGVLELPAGWLDRTGTALGHRIEFFKSSPEAQKRRGVDSDRPETSI
ncbi:MAG: DUF192 domain-containing protein [Vicinamibacterales bacterium]